MEVICRYLQKEKHLTFYENRLEKKDYINLFLVIAFPFHGWALYQVFRDVEWVVDRTNLGDAFGYGSYSLLFAFLESALFLLFILLLGYLMPKRWKGNQLVGQLGLIVLVVAFWLMIEQIISMQSKANMRALIQYIFHFDHPLRITYAIGIILVPAVIGSFLLPIYLIDSSKKFELLITSLFNRLYVLSSLFIFLDVIGFFFVLYRNIINII